MPWLVFLLALIGGAATAKASLGGLVGPLEGTKRPEQPRTAEEAYHETEKGRFMQYLNAEVDAGRMTLEQSIIEYRKKFYGGQMPDYRAVIANPPKQAKPMPIPDLKGKW